MGADLSGQRLDLLRQLHVLPRQVGVGGEELLELVRLALDRSLALLDPPHDCVAVLLRTAERDLVALGLAGLREENQRRGVRRLRREDEVEENEGVGSQR